MKRKFKQYWSITLPISTKRTATSHIKQLRTQNTNHAIWFWKLQYNNSSGKPQSYKYRTKTADGNPGRGMSSSHTELRQPTET